MIPRIRTTITAGEKIPLTFDFNDVLTSTQVISGSPTITSSIVSGSTNNLTVSGIGISDDMKKVSCHIQCPANAKDNHYSIVCSAGADGFVYRVSAEIVQA